jgi:hypothetical protein
MYVIERTYRNKMYSNFIFNYMKIERDRWNNIKIKKESSKPEGSQACVHPGDTRMDFSDGDQVADELPALFKCLFFRFFYILWSMYN